MEVNFDNRDCNFRSYIERGSGFLRKPEKTSPRQLMWLISPRTGADNQLMKNEQLFTELRDTTQLHKQVFEVQTQYAAEGAQTVQAVPATESSATTVTPSGRSPLLESNVATEQAVRAKRATLHAALPNSSLHCIQSQINLTLKQKKIVNKGKQDSSHTDGEEALRRLCP